MREPRDLLEAQVKRYAKMALTPAFAEVVPPLIANAKELRTCLRLMLDLHESGGMVKQTRDLIIDKVRHVLDITE